MPSIRQTIVRVLIGAVALGGVLLPGALAPEQAHAASFAVNSTNDVNDGACNVAHCSLREAINAANATLGADTITFSLGAGTPTISPATGLPGIAEAVTIDGSSGGATRVQILGTSAGIFADGIAVAAGPTTILDLIISDFADAGIEVNAGTVTVQGNWIGTDTTGNASDGNVVGIRLHTPGNTIGGTTAAQRNVISGNGEGIAIPDAAASGQVISGNYIGAGADGATDVGNSFDGIDIRSPNNTIGGATPQHRNVISGNNQRGIRIASEVADGNDIFNNQIGVKAGTIDPLPNGEHGISIADADNTNIGGGESTFNYIISNSQDGINISGAVTNVSIDGNAIFSNLGHGISIASATGGHIGSTNGSNTIAFNGGAGIHVHGTASLPIYENQFGENGGLAIDISPLGPDGPTLNDVDDADTGPNSVMNFPVITSIISSGGNTTIAGVLNGNPAEDNSGIAIQFYDTDTCDASGYGEGSYFASTVISLDESNLGYFNATFAYDLEGTVTATATNTFFETSEFSKCLTPTNDYDSDGDFDAVDSCPTIANAGQENADRNFIDISPPKGFDDLSRAMSDVHGDACDADDDNDGRQDDRELAGYQCIAATDPLDPDTDGDNYIDGAECLLGTDPTLVTSRPTNAQCGTNTDVDGDKLIEFREFCFYGTEASAPNSDGDICNDGREAASINASSTVDVIDLQQVASEAGIYTLPAAAVKAAFDITKNGNIDVIDLQQVAALSGICP